MNDLFASAHFPDVRFSGQLRPSQADVVTIARDKLNAGKRSLHIVAPPGSGKTVLGLYLWAECVRQPALVLSPNSAIQAQWAARTDLFVGLPDGTVSIDSQAPALLTSLTYQAVTLPTRASSDIDEQALLLWQERLIEQQQAENPEEATLWLEDLQRHNSAYYQQRLAAFRKQVREELTLAPGSEALQTLHQSSLQTLHALRKRGLGLIILDECHHLLGHWGRILANAHDLLQQPIVIGLTATPPDRGGKRAADVQRYDTYFGAIDYEVPVPAVVKDGFLAPYQDLAYFVRPSQDELVYIANADDELHAIVAELCREESVSAEEAKVGALTENLPNWLLRVLGEYRLPTGVQKDWTTFARRDPDFADAARLFLLTRGLELPDNVPEPVSDLSLADVPEMTYLIPVLDRYVRHRLRRSEHQDDHRLAEQVIRRLRTLGVQITDTGSQACASPVGRVMAYSSSKIVAIIPILKAECAVLGKRIRACIVADYEKTSAVSSEVQHLLDDEAGGAIAVFKVLLADPITDNLDPILVTGSSVLIDDDMAPRFESAAQDWLSQNQYKVEFELGMEEGFHVINGKGSDWSPRVYVEMITEFFQSGLSKCLIGTRGLLGEGWDANKINVLIDLTTVTTSMTVNQLRGRSIRLDPQEPEKVANNWDVVCIAPEFSKGFDDYQRFMAKHKTLYGVTDDGAIEKGVGHVHAAFTELKPEGLEDSVNLLNEDMLSRVNNRAKIRQLWRIGEPYQDKPVQALEVPPLTKEGSGGFPPFAKSNSAWNGHSLTLAIGNAILAALRDANLLEGSNNTPTHIGERAGGYVRVFLDKATEQDNATFTQALHEALGPLHRPRYVIPRYVDRLSDTFLSSLLPQIIGKYFQKRRRLRAMLHAVPSVLAKNKMLVLVYQRHWNEQVSPGEAIYAHHGSGELLVEEARRAGQVPTGVLHEKEIFL